MGSYDELFSPNDFKILYNVATVVAHVLWGWASVFWVLRRNRHRAEDYGILRNHRCSTLSLYQTFDRYPGNTAEAFEY